MPAESDRQESAEDEARRNQCQGYPGSETDHLQRDLHAAHLRGSAYARGVPQSAHRRMPKCCRDLIVGCAVDDVNAMPRFVSALTRRRARYCTAPTYAVIGRICVGDK